MTTPKIALIPSGYKSGKVYSVLPFDGSGDFTLTRTSTGTRVNKDGITEEMASGVPRLDYSNGDCPTLLLERSSTNLLPYSTLAFNGGASPTGYSIGSGTGTYSYEELIYNGQGASKQTQITEGRSYLDTGSLTLTANVEHTLKIQFILAECNANASDVIIFFTNFGASPTYTFGDIDSDGILDVKFNPLSDNIGNIRIGLGANGNMIGGSYLTFTQPQLEVGSTATSFIPTSGSIVTRTDDLVKKGGLSNLIGQVEGTVFLDFEYLLDLGTDAANDALRDIFIVGSDFNTTNVISIDNYRSQFRIFVTANGVTSSIGTGSTGSAQANTRYKLAFRYKNGNSKAFLNGVQIGSSTNSVNFTNTLDSVFFSYNNSTNIFKNQKRVYDLRTYTEGLLDAELIQLTTI